MLAYRRWVLVFCFFFTSRGRHSSYALVTGFRRVLFRSQAGRLARAIGAEHAVNAARRHQKADVIDRLERLEIFGEVARLEDRKSVVKGKSVSVRVDLGGRRIIKKQNAKNTYDHT